MIEIVYWIPIWIGMFFVGWYVSPRLLKRKSCQNISNGKKYKQPTIIKFKPNEKVEFLKNGDVLITRKEKRD
jgi:hypothetical protein